MRYHSAMAVAAPAMASAIKTYSMARRALPVTNETVCNYDEGFIAGILEAYTGKKYDVREVDCWASGDRVCRFSGVVVQ